MKNPKLVSLLLIVLATISAISCKKNNTNALGNSLIVFVNYTNTNGAGAHYRIVYDANNNVDSIITVGGGTDTGTNGYLAFTYLNSSYIITDNNNNSTTIDMNAHVMIDTIFSTYPTYIAYNGTQVAVIYNKAPTTVYPFTAVNIYDYTYSNGDITAINITGTATTYDYNLSKSGQLGDPQRIDQFLSYGRPYTLSSHLATDMYLNGTLQEQYAYLFDNQGRITQLTKVINTGGGTNDTLRYAYVYNY